MYQHKHTTVISDDCSFFKASFKIVETNGKADVGFKKHGGHIPSAIWEVEFDIDFVEFDPGKVRARSNNIKLQNIEMS